MKISTKGRYALRLMLDLALNEGSRPVRIKEISERQGISDKYLEQIISTLVKNSFVISTRGPQGGYHLSKKPDNYTVGSILRAIEGKLCPVACLETEENLCDRKDECITLLLWEKLDKAINDVVDSITLQDLIDWNNKK
ncbi:MAG: RrF2 family transcriptional regulator [Lachnospiraceae bacterium]